MLRMVILAGLLALGLAASPAVASEVLQPSGPWKIDYAPNECRLLRSFGTGDAAVTLRFARGAGFDSFDMLIAGPGIPKQKDRLKVQLKLLPSGEVQEFSAYSMIVPGRPERFVRWFDGDPKILDSVTDTQQLEITIDGNYVITANLAKGKAALGGLNHCYGELLASWGIDPSQYAAGTVRAKPRTSSAGWVSPGDYPWTTLLSEKSGASIALLSVSPAGKVTKCRIVVSSKITALDDATCRALTAHGKFFPALNAAGQPIVGYAIERILWLIPEE